MRPVATAAEMRALDEATIREIGLPGSVLMETAGRAVAAAAGGAMAGGGRVAVVCGGGNNGGDGFVAARVLRAAGIDARVYLAVPLEAVHGDARLFLDAWVRSGGEVIDVSSPERRPALAELGDARVVVDALFGTGLARPVVGHFAAIIDDINALPAAIPRIAVDLPSGLSADTGHPLGVAVRADRTVTMAVSKVGIAGAPGLAWAGCVEVAEIGIPRSLIERQGLRAAIVEAEDVMSWRPRASALDHKGRRGHVLVVGGSPGMRGAARLSGLGALRAGAGLCTIAGRAADEELVAPDALMTAVVRGADDVRRLAVGKSAVVVGPGLAGDDRGPELLAAVLSTEGPVVIDATGLSLVAADGAAGLARIAARPGSVVLTPHPGEAGRLLGVSAAVVEADRMAAVRRLAAASGGVVVLKGARTLICDGRSDDFVSINPTGGPALSTAGSGDVLAGVIGAFLAQGLSPVAAARVAVWAHGAAGDALTHQFGDRGVIASDLPEAISRALR